MKTDLKEEDRVVVGGGGFPREFTSRGGMIFNPGGSRPCFNYVRLTENAGGECSLVFRGAGSETVRDTLFEGPHEKFSLEFADRLKPLRLSWEFRFFENAPGYESRIEFVSGVFPGGDWTGDGAGNMLDFLPLEPDTVLIHLAEFRAATDYHNEFIRFSRHELKHPPEELRLDGNVLRTEKPDGSGTVIMKVSPSHHERREKIKTNFKVEKDGIAVYGWGVEPHEFILNTTMRTYPLIVVPYQGGHFGAVGALRDFLRRRWEHSFNSGPRAMVNPWGGGRKHLWANLGESWVLREMKSAAELGAGVYQIDDGWQEGSSRALFLDGAPADGEFWKVSRQRFPNGFSGLAEAGRKLGVKLGLWFAPDRNRQYHNWEEEADFISARHREDGFEYFKIDGVSHRSYAAERNFDNLLRKAFADTGKKILFNLDVTNGIRMGFLYSPEFGPLFPANRYPFVPDGSPNKYYPCNTLRNFWKLAHIIPPHLIQVEVPDIFCDPSDFTEYGDNRYAGSDPGNPSGYGPLYCAMIAFFGSPLFWLQPSRIDKKLMKEYSRVAALFAECGKSLHGGSLWPVGETPDGSSFTGFLSRQGDSGFILVFRERTERRKASIFLPGIEKAAVETVFSNTVPSASIEDGCLDILLEDAPSFALLAFSGAV